MKITELRLSTLRAIEVHKQSKTAAELVPLIQRPNDKITYMHAVYRCVRDLISGGALVEEKDILKLTELGYDMLDQAQKKADPDPIFFVPIKPKK